MSPVTSKIAALLAPEPVPTVNPLLKNESPIDDFDSQGPFDIDGNPDYVTYKVSNLSGDVSINSDNELYCAYFNQNGVATSGSFYSGFISIPEINFETNISTLGYQLCLIR
jgi:hypothetical protein